MAYPVHGRGIQYKGPKKAEHMMRFLQSMMNPFKRISSIPELNEYRAHCDVSIAPTILYFFFDIFLIAVRFILSVFGIISLFLKIPTWNLSFFKYTGCIN